MLFQENDSLEEIWQTVKHELHLGALDPKHPFHWINLGTISGDFPSVRTVVLRKLTQDFQFLVFTDYRSAKCSDLQANPNASLHFYHPKKQVQIRIKALTILHFQDDMADKFWKTIPSHRRTEYTGVLPPGTPLSKPTTASIEREDTGQFFSVLEFSPAEIEVLQFHKSGHLRALFSQKADWKGTWITP